MSTPSPNRFERHARLITTTAAVGLVVLALVALEWILTPRAGRHTAKALGDSPSPQRSLVMREWRPSTDYVFAPPPERLRYPQGGLSQRYTLSTDKDGFIEPAVRHATPDAEIVFLGGSTTECLYVEPQKRFPHLSAVLLERKLGLKINGLNAARSGNTTMHASALLVAKVLPRRPAVVVLMENVNDLGILRAHGSYWPARGGQRLVESESITVGEGLETLAKATLPYTFQALLEAKRVLLRGKRSTAAASEVKTEREPAVLDAATSRLVRDYESSIRAFVRTVAAWGARPVLMTQVLVRARTDAERSSAFVQEGQANAAGLGAGGFERLHDLLNETLRRVAAEEQAVLIDLARARDWQFGDVYDTIHFTDRGSELVANIVAEALERVLTVAKPPIPR